MKKNHIVKLIAAGAIAALCAFGIAGCSAESEEDAVPDGLTADTGLTGGVAATINGVEIEEDKVTRAINNMRLSYGYEEDDKWKEYLEKRKYTVESLRYEVLGSFIDQELVKQCAEQRGATTDEAEIDSYVEKVSSQYSSEEAWQKAVDDSGWDDLDAYKEALHYSILDKKLKEGFESEVDASLNDPAALLAKINDSKTSYDNAKKTSHILFTEDQEDLANEVYEELINNEIDFASAVQEYSTDETSKADGGNVGWDKTNQFVTEYTDAINELELGAISKPVKSKYGYHIITVTDVWTAPESITDASQMPEEFVTEIRTNAVETDGKTNYDNWLKSMRPANDVKINPMPDDVPYWVDMSDVYDEEEAKKITDKAYNLLITGVEEEETDVTDAEAATDAAAEAAAADNPEQATADLAAAAMAGDAADAEAAAESAETGAPAE